MEEQCYKDCGIEEVKIALFGNDGNKGLIKKVDEMHAIFTNTKWTGKLLFGIIAGIGVITGSVVGVIELIKRIK